MTSIFRYPAIRLKQSRSDKTLVMFGAPATEINLWAGVPQKKRFGVDQESIGFQREENEKRIQSLKQFFGNDENVVQNALLCASRVSDLKVLAFTPIAAILNLNLYPVSGILERSLSSMNVMSASQLSNGK